MNKTTLEDIQLIDIPKISDPDGRGNLSVIEKEMLPFKIERVYYLYDVPSNSSRGGHAHIELRQCLIALSGSFDVVLDDGQHKKVVTLNRPNVGLLIPTGIWRELENFSSGGVCLSLVSDVYKESDYIRDYPNFLSLKRA
jgi:dTDP-4-dehydrorhamnose 3,5-epimerase-like enzyme